MTRFTNWLSRWRLKRIIAALHFATGYGLRPEVVDFVQALEATSHMARGNKKNMEVKISCTREQLDSFITYMHRLHTSKLSLWHRARIGLATLTLKATHVLGETPEDFVSREFPKSKSSKDDKVVIQLK